MNKTINNVVELTEKELECVTGGVIIVGGEGRRIEKKPAPYALMRRQAS